MTRFHLILLVPFLAAALIPAIGCINGKLRDAVAVLAALATGGLAISLVPLLRTHLATAGLAKGMLVVQGVYNWLPGLVSYDVLLDSLSLTVALVAGCVGALIVIFSLGYMAGEAGQTRYYALVLLFIGGMIGMVLSDSLLFLFLFWEVIGVCSYALIGFYYRDLKAANAGLKAFMTTKVGDFALLAGILLLYCSGAHTMSITGIIANLPLYPAETLSLAAFLFLAGAIGKSAQVPLHVWLPDAMEAQSTISALIHAATLVNSGVYLMARMSPVFGGIETFTAVLMWVGAGTALIAATLAVVEADLKRILAYSTVSQLGYMMYAVGLGAIFATQYHLLSHAIFKALLFLSAGAIIHSLHTRNMYEMGGLAKRMPAIHLFMSAGLLSLAGVPIFCGFWSKDLILATGWHEMMAGHAVRFIGPFLCALVAAIFTAAYSLKIYLLVFRGAEKGDRSHLHLPGLAMTGPLGILAAGTLVVWLPIGKMSALAVRTLNLPVPFKAMGFKALVHHTLVAPAFYLSLVALAIGFIVVRRRPAGFTGDHFRLATGSRLLGNHENRVQWYLLLRRAFYFDRIYYGLIDHILLPIGAFVKSFLDGTILETVNDLVRRVSLGAAGVLRRTQTGDLNLNVAGLVFALTIATFAVYWVNQW